MKRIISSLCYNKSKCIPYDFYNNNVLYLAYRPNVNKLPLCALHYYPQSLDQTTWDTSSAFWGETLHKQLNQSLVFDPTLYRTHLYSWVERDNVDKVSFPRTQAKCTMRDSKPRPRYESEPLPLQHILYFLYIISPIWMRMMFLFLLSIISSRKIATTHTHTHPSPTHPHSHIN